MATAANPTRDDFEALLNEQLGDADEGGFEGRVVKGTVTAIENGMALIDVGLKSEGRVDLREFMRVDDEHGLEVGSEVDEAKVIKRNLLDSGKRPNPPATANDLNPRVPVTTSPQPTTQANHRKN